MGNFSNYWDLTTLFTKIGNKIKAVAGSIPTKLSDLTDDATHRTVSDTEKSTWNGKANVTTVTIPVFIPSPGGWRRVCKIKVASGSTAGGMIYVGGNWSNGQPISASVAVNIMHTSASLTLLSSTNGINSVFRSMRLIPVSSGVYWLDVFFNTYSNGSGPHRLTFTGDIAVSDIQDPISITTDSTAATDEISIYQYVHGTVLTDKSTGLAKTLDINSTSFDIASKLSVDESAAVIVSDSNLCTTFSGETNSLSGVVSRLARNIYAWNLVAFNYKFIYVRTDASFTVIRSFYVTDTPTFTEASTRANIASGETMPTILGKIKKFFTDLKTVAFSGSYNDLSNKPTIPAAANNGTLTIQKNGTNVQTFSANQSTNVTANITVPTTASDVNAAPASDVPFKFGVDSSGNYGYIKAGADTVIPFKTVGTRSSNITANGTYTASSDISKDGYSSVTVAVPNSVQTKTVTPGTSQMYVTPDAGYIGLSQVTINVANNQYKTVSPTESAQIVRPDTGYWLSGVTVGAIATQTKSVTPSTSAQTVTPDSGKYLTSVSVGAISTQEKTVTSSRSAQTVTPDSGKYLSKVTVNALAPTGTYTASSRSTSLDMGATSNYRYVNTNGVPNSNSSTYTIPRSYGTKDLGATNSYRYVDPTDFGDWQYDLGYDSGSSDGYAERTPVTLWTNSSPGSNFAAKTITISNLTWYQYIFVICRLQPHMTGYTQIAGGFAPNNIGTTWTISDSTTINYMGLNKVNFTLGMYGTFTGIYRYCYFNGSNQITIGNGTQQNNGVIIASGNQWFVPEKIIGVL